MKTEFVEKTEQDRVIELMCQILELQKSSERIVVEIIKEKGVWVFFDSYEALAVTELEKGRIASLKTIIETKEKEISKMEGAEINGN